MFIETLLSKALDASLGMLADYGLKKASELRGKLLGAAEPRQRAFEAAWQKAAEKIEEPRLRSLLEHRPFQEQVAAALLDKLNLLDIKAAIKGWSGVLTRPEARLLEDFMRHLGELLLADDAWGDILGRYHTLRFQEETLQALRQRQLPEDDRQLVQYVSQAIQGDVITGGEKHDIRVGDVYGQYVNIADIVEQTVVSQAIEGDNRGAVVQNNQGFLVQIVQNFVCEHPGFSVESIQRQVRQYVNWLDENFKDIVIKGIKRKDSEIVHLPLEQVFAPLEGEYQEMPGNAMGSRKRASTRQAPEEQEKHSVVLPLHRALSLGNRIVITGGPGCGKSTVLIYLAWKLAHAWKDGTDGDARAILGFEGPLPLPVYLPLSQYARYLRDLPAGTESRKKRLDYFIADYMEERHQTTDLERTIGFISHLLEKEENLLVLLDGLDEVPTVTEREQVSQAIEELVSGRQFLRVVATSRTAAFTGNVVLGAQFKHLRVLPMKSEHIEGIVRASYQCIYEGSETLANEKAAEMLEQIESVEAQRKLRMGNQYERLVDTPLMARIFLIIHHGEAHLPEQRAELYKKAVEVLLRPDYAVDKRVTQDIERRIGESPNVSLGMHQHLAFQMHSLGQEQGREISEEALRDILSCDPTFSPHVDNLVHVVTERGTLLEKRDKLFRFQHLSFQEYLVGRALVQTLHEPGRIADFFEKGPVLDSWWREPALLMAGYLNMEAVERLPALLSRLARLEELPTAEKLPLDTQLAMAELAAAAYLECIPRPAHLAGPLQERLKALVWLSEGAPRRHADAAEALDRLGWTPGDLHTFVEVPGAGVWIGKYPVTNGQYARFVEAQDFAEPQYWQAFPRFGEPPAYEKMEDWGTRGWDWLQSRLEDKDYSPDGKRVYPRDWDEARFGKTRPSAPVVGVSWFEANAYCRWLQAHWAEQPECRENKSLQPQAIRLPLEREWAAAAGGEAGERYAWDLGKAASELAEVLRRANVWESGIQRTTPVWAYPLGASPWGVWDLSGNVWEWQANYYDKDRDWLAWRGGSWSYDRNLARCAARHGFAPYGFHDYLGFRLVCSPSKSEF